MGKKSVVVENNSKEICRLYDLGHSRREIKRKFGVSDSPIERILHNSGKTLRNYSQANRIKKREAVEKVIPMVDDGATMVKIEEETKLSEWLIRKIITEDGRLTKRKEQRIKQKEKIPQILSLFDQGYSLRNIYYKVRCDYYFIQKALDKFRPKKRRKVFQDIMLTQEEKAIILGSLLGDACIYDGTKSKKTANVRWTYVNKEYAEFLLQKLKRISNYRKPTKRLQDNGYRGNGTYWHFETRALCSLKELDNLVKKKDKKTGKLRKTVTLEWLHRLTPFSLAVWYMDDGTKLPGGTIYICTQSFSYFEHKIIQNYFQKKWKIKTHIYQAPSDKPYYKLKIDVNSIDYFFDLIKPYVVDSMKYKLLQKVPVLICSWCGGKFKPLRSIWGSKIQGKNVNCGNPKCMHLSRLYLDYKHREIKRKLAPLTSQEWMEAREEKIECPFCREKNITKFHFQRFYGDYPLACDKRECKALADKYRLYKYQQKENVLNVKDWLEHRKIIENLKCSICGQFFKGSFNKLPDKRKKNIFCYRKECLHTQRLYIDYCYRYRENSLELDSWLLKREEKVLYPFKI